MKIQLSHRFEDIISVDNLLEAWHEFSRGKRKRKDVQDFAFLLMDNIFSLHNDLASGAYRHGGYHAFRIADPKPRDIHKASVRDRMLHHAVYRILYPFFDKTFIADSFSCRVGKGTHMALNRFKEFGYQVSRNHTKTCWVLKGDIKKFFANIDHDVLAGVLGTYISDRNIVCLLANIIGSFNFIQPGAGLPLGNLTSQLFVNVYMNEFDQFVKHMLKAKYYIRYADDFVILSEDRNWMESQIMLIRKFLQERLKLAIHEDKIFVRTLSSGVDWLGWIHFSDHRVLRTATKRRMIKRIQSHPTQETVNSYFGLLQYGNARTLQTKIINEQFSSSF
ncbi:MAG: hypothetical protein AUJ34_02440 [Parcubacteria group bacterium CG1_02_41_12]|nr:MAG: hypothetical protein AUJ34_02440 [Parcubacteria group bacterium CG1_02_41_12]